ncbi:hypothetical protein HPB47_018112 [Ixodes persulcatus]|uniref:Uncharacterized protein n=1 Tax=Ixodes persulcatus TaxID=34615 RepID=A0AC60R321_IXOPE|nr:hypothetical protein HPB47_018112 [Ixodes persulcatus]
MVQPSSLYVRAGEHDETVHEGSEIQVRVTHVYLHPRYVHLHRDVAIVRLAKRLRLSRFVQPICLPPGDILLDPSLNCTISGWGNTFMQGTTSPVLNKLPVPLRPLSDCQQVYGRVFRTPINAWHLCGGSPLGFKGVCYGAEVWEVGPGPETSKQLVEQEISSPVLGWMQARQYSPRGSEVVTLTLPSMVWRGDSGGPMSCQLTDSRWYLVGLASFGPGCAKGHHAGRLHQGLLLL